MSSTSSASQATTSTSEDTTSANSALSSSVKEAVKTLNATEQTPPVTQTSATAEYMARQTQAINTFKALMKLPVPNGQKYSVWAYALIDDPRHVKVAMVIPLGNYPDKAEAVKRVKFIIETTGHHAVFATKMHKWEELTTEINTDRTEYVPVDMNGKLIKLHEDQQKKEQEKLEERKRIEEELLREKAAELNPSSIEHYINNWYVAIKTWARLQHTNKLRDVDLEVLEERLDKIRKQTHEQPEYEKTWLPVLKEQLSKRNELILYETLAATVEEMKKDLCFTSTTTDEISLVPESSSNMAEGSDPEDCRDYKGCGEREDCKRCDNRREEESPPTVIKSMKDLNNVTPAASLPTIMAEQTPAPSKTEWCEQCGQSEQCEQSEQCDMKVNTLAPSESVSNPATESLPAETATAQITSKPRSEAGTATAKSTANSMNQNLILSVKQSPVSLPPPPVMATEPTVKVPTKLPPPPSKFSSSRDTNCEICFDDVCVMGPADEQSQHLEFQEVHTSDIGLENENLIHF
jgi:hypothetical protein